jgi:hypothetical protein
MSNVREAIDSFVRSARRPALAEPGEPLLPFTPETLQREFAEWELAGISTEADLEHSLSPTFPRALLRRGNRALAAIAAPPDEGDPSAILTFALIC